LIIRDDLTRFSAGREAWSTVSAEGMEVILRSYVTILL